MESRKTCLCGCGGTNIGLKGWVRGHWSRKKKELFTCKGCGLQEYRIPWKTNKKYCSHKCYSENSETWITGLTKETDERVRLLAEKTKKNHHNVSGENNPMFGKKGSLSPAWNPNREEIKMKQRLRGICKSLLHRSLPKSKVKKSKRTEEMLGYTKEQLCIHLESLFVNDMNWENYGDGKGKWHVDHIRPISSFDVKTPVNIISELSNLRPLWSEENHRKSDKWEK